MKWKAYRNETLTVLHPQPFRQQEALDLIRVTHAELDQSGPWPAHLISWLQEHHQMALKAIHETTKGVTSACLSHDTSKFERVLVEYKAAWVEGLYLWREQHSDIQATEK